jgi:formylglycine-generating enzyme required for sulfatase activity
MTSTVKLWSGREVRALREAKRMSIRTFAAALGISERMVSKWEAAGARINQRPINQHALDTFLAASGADVHDRFAALLGTPQREANLHKPAPAVVAGVPSGESQHQVRHPVDGKLMALVEGGVFLCGESNEGVSLPGFYMDVFPTTNGDYARFVAATGHASPHHWEDGRPPGPDLNDHPVVFVSWRDAMAYATWAAKSLPTGQQWEKAARGSQGDIYPWGSQATPAKCNVREGGLRSTTPVSRFHSGVSPYGIYDLCGNTWEWCSSGIEPDRYELKGSAFTGSSELRV